LEPVAQRIMQLASQNGTRQASPAREPAPAVQTKAAAPDAEPLAVEELPPLDDVLDIDFLEEPAAFTGGRPELPAEIFRAYDIRGVVGRTLTPEYVYWLGRAIGSESLDAGQPQVAVARDGRLSGPRSEELPPLDDVLDIDFLEEPAAFTGGRPELPAEIFRAYDIRGVVGRTLTPEYVYWLGRAIGSESLDAGQPQVAVARDGRLSGP